MSPVLLIRQASSSSSTTRNAADTTNIVTPPPRYGPPLCKPRMFDSVVSPARIPRGTTTGIGTEEFLPGERIYLRKNLIRRYKRVTGNSSTSGGITRIPTGRRGFVAPRDEILDLDASFMGNFEDPNMAKSNTYEESGETDPDTGKPVVQQTGIDPQDVSIPGADKDDPTEARFRMPKKGTLNKAAIVFRSEVYANSTLAKHQPMTVLQFAMSKMQASLRESNRSKVGGVTQWFKGLAGASLFADMVTWAGRRSVPVEINYPHNPGRTRNSFLERFDFVVMMMRFVVMFTGAEFFSPSVPSTAVPRATIIVAAPKNLDWNKRK